MDGQSEKFIQRVGSTGISHPMEGTFKGPQLVEETVDIFKFGSDVFCIVCPEEIEPMEGIGELQATIAAGNLSEVSMCTQLIIPVQSIGWVIITYQKLTPA